MGRPISCEMLKLKEHLEIMILLMSLRLVKDGGKVGEILKIKPLAALAMIDEGELDWKIVAISLDDPRASLVNDIDGVEKHFPGTLTAIRDWFRDYKIPDGKPANKFGLGNKAANKVFYYLYKKNKVIYLIESSRVCYSFVGC
ncbi:hypothetical protein OIU76_020207 [Salix suchowensis]|nr:hypothetical protein OIU76_020207 [Salix suchowensis]